MELIFFLYPQQGLCNVQEYQDTVGLKCPAELANKIQAEEVKLFNAITPSIRHCVSLVSWVTHCDRKSAGMHLQLFSPNTQKFLRI